jgi:hypothetical protein
MKKKMSSYIFVAILAIMWAIMAYDIINGVLLEDMLFK